MVIGVEFPRYSFDIRSMATSSNFISYINDQEDLIEKLSINIKKVTTYRLYFDNWGWGIKAKLRKKSKEIKFNYGTKNSFKNQLKSNRLTLVTYPATTYNELINKNVPIVCYWNRDFWKLENEAEKLLDLFIEVGIFHDTAMSAARHVDEIWENIDYWWFSSKVQKARKLWIKKYACDPIGIGKINNVLKKL